MCNAPCTKTDYLLSDPFTNTPAGTSALPTSPRGRADVHVRPSFTNGTTRLTTTTSLALSRDLRLGTLVAMALRPWLAPWPTGLGEALGADE
jgi:hypothetical protein